ncbi:MAG: hypothetical protein PHU14_10230 [Methylovulum sp.]|nr:hypothetical protein [Methylovulum sp.]
MKAIALVCLLLAGPALAQPDQPHRVKLTVTGVMEYWGVMGAYIKPKKGSPVHFATATPQGEAILAHCQDGDVCTLSGWFDIDRDGAQLQQLLFIKQVTPLPMDTLTPKQATGPNAWRRLTVIGRVHYGTLDSAVSADQGPDIGFLSDTKIGGKILRRCTRSAVCKVSGWVSPDNTGTFIDKLAAVTRLSPAVVIGDAPATADEDDWMKEVIKQGRLAIGRDAHGRGVWLTDGQDVSYRLAYTAQLPRPVRTVLEQLAADGSLVAVTGTLNVRPVGAATLDTRLPIRVFK